MTTVIAVLVCVTLLGACSLPRMHRVVIQQGNVVTQEMIDKLRPGMSREQVSFIMGQPVMRNTFDDDRWDFVYTLEVPGAFRQTARSSLYFHNDVLAYFTGDLAPAEWYPKRPEAETAETAETAEDG